MSRSVLAAGWALALDLALPTLAFAQDHAEDGGELSIFAVNPGLIIWTWVLFGLTLLILSWKVFPAISGGLEQRHARIRDAIDAAARSQEEAKALIAEQKAQLEAARREAQEMIDKGRSAAENVKKEMLAEAKEQQAAILADARREIQSERDKLKAEVRKEAAEVALAAAEQLLRRRVDSEENRRLVDEFVSELS